MNFDIIHKTTSMRKIACAYFDIKKMIIDLGYAEEIDWQEDIRKECTDESDFLREASWVILCSGMRESVIRNKFSLLSSVFYNWASSRLILTHRMLCRNRALRIFNHVRKIDAILEIAEYVDTHGYKNILDRLDNEGISFLTKFSFIGSTTAFHLAKNIGFPVSKPDRHLTRIALAIGFTSPDLLCRSLSEFTGEKIAVVDLVLWRYATLVRNYAAQFTAVCDVENCFSFMEKSTVLAMARS